MKVPYEKMSELELLIENLKELRAIKEELKKDKKITAQDIDLISNADLMRILGISEKATRELRKCGELRFITIGRLIFYRIVDVQAMIQEKFDRK